jgi:hypothetical protein
MILHSLFEKSVPQVGRMPAFGGHRAFVLRTEPLRVSALTGFNRISQGE